MRNPLGRIERRQFLGIAAGAALGATAVLQAQETQPAAPPKIDRKLKVGIVGCGGRGSWIAGLFKEHGGYEFVSVADYHADRAQRTGTALGADKSRCYSGLSGYKRLIDTGVDAVILEVPPYFFPERAAAAVEADLHVYMAKPVAADVPGTLRIGQLGKLASEKKRVFYVDYQMPTDPINIEVRKRLLQGDLGKLQMIFSCGAGGGSGSSDPPLGPTIENRLTDLIWVNDDAMGCGYLGNFDIHVIDAIIWALGQRPFSAYGRGGRCRKDPHGDSFDTNFVTFTMADGLTWNHHSACGPTHDWLKQGSLEGSIQGSEATARLSYWGKSYIRFGPKQFPGGEVADLYNAGARRNIAAFYQKVIAGDVANETAQRSVDSTLTCILGREAARRGALLTMDELIRENRRLEVNLTGLKA